MGKTTRQPKTAAPLDMGRDGVHDVETKMDDLKLDPRGDGMYSGTFRWLETKQFARLPPRSTTAASNNNNDDDALCLTKGWEGFLRSRGGAALNLVETAKKDPSCLDALSFPVTFLHAASTLQLMATPGVKHVVVLGATRKAEQRVWQITDYWFEIAHCYEAHQITLWFVGPEVDESCKTQKPSQPTNLQVKHLKGTYADFVNHEKARECTPINTVLVGYNTGFGNFVDSGRFDLLFSWLPDLYAISNTGFPTIFTCANDYADMNGEFAVQSRIVGANMLLLPQQNPFSMASHLHEEGKKDTAWSRGNSFLYAIQGCDTNRRLDLKSGDVIALQNRLDASLDLHLQDALGRHFYKGMVLSKEQASRCKSLQDTAVISGKKTPSRSRSNSLKSPARSRSNSALALVTPTFEILPGAQPEEVVLLVHIPAANASDRIAVDVSDASLSLLIPDKYALRATLPFQVENNAPVRSELASPFLKLTCTRK